MPSPSVNHKEIEEKIHGKENNAKNKGGEDDYEDKQTSTKQEICVQVSHPCAAVGRAEKAEKTSDIEDSPFKAGKKARLTHGMVNYLLEGPEASARLVVLLHGFNSSLASFETMLPYFWKQGFRTLVYDHYGHGLSSLPCFQQLNHTMLAKQLEELLDAVAPDFQKVELMGFSMGGIVASEFARSRPERVSRLCLLAPAGLLDKDQTPHKCLLFNCLRGPAGCCLVGLVTGIVAVASTCCGVKSKLKNSKAALEELAPDVSCPEQFAEISKRNLHRIAANPARTATTYLRVLRRMPMWNDECGIYEHLAQGSVPVLFIWGEEDGAVPLDEVGPDLARIFGPSGAPCLVVDGTGHHSFLEFPERIAQYAMNWFSDFQDPVWKEHLEQGRVCLARLGRGTQCSQSVKEAAKQAPQAATFVTGEQVEVYSSSQQEWLIGEILEVADNGAINVQHKFGQKRIVPDQLATTVRKLSKAEEGLDVANFPIQITSAEVQLETKALPDSIGQPRGT